METMTVKQLTEKLAEFDDDLSVVLVDEGVRRVFCKRRFVGKKTHVGNQGCTITNAIGFLYRRTDDL